MNLSLGTLAQLAKYKDLKTADLSVTALQDISKILGLKVKVSDELLSAAVVLLQGNDIHKAADLIQSPESLGQLIQLFKGPTPQEDDEPIEILFI